MIAKTNKIARTVVSIEKDHGMGNYWVDFAIQLSDNTLVNVHYTFDRSTVRNNITNSLKVGMYVSVTVRQEVEPDKIFSYTGLGAIKVHDLSSELQAQAKIEFAEGGSSEFNADEVKIIRASLLHLKATIQESFDINKEATAKINGRIDVLSDMAESLPRFDWQNLFVKCVIGVSIDLGFGSTIPDVLYNLFKRVIEEFADHKVKSIGDQRRQMVTDKKST